MTILCVAIFRKMIKIMNDKNYQFSQQKECYKYINL